MLLEIMFGGAGAILLTLLCIRFWRAALGIVLVATVGVGAVFWLTIWPVEREHQARMKASQEQSERASVARLPLPCGVPDKDGWAIVCQ